MEYVVECGNYKKKVSADSHKEAALKALTEHMDSLEGILTVNKKGQSKSFDTLDLLAEINEDKMRVFEDDDEDDRT